MTREFLDKLAIATILVLAVCLAMGLFIGWIFLLGSHTVLALIIAFVVIVFVIALGL